MRDRAQGETWARYLTSARQAAGLTKAELARAAGIGRATVFRWEGGDTRPEQADIVARVADVLGVDLDEALAAAGLRPHPQPPDRPARQTPPVDPDVAYLLRRLADPLATEREKALIREFLRFAARQIAQQTDDDPPAAAAR